MPSGLGRNQTWKCAPPSTPAIEVDTGDVADPTGRMTGEGAAYSERWRCSISRVRAAIASSNGQAIDAFSSTSGRNCHDVMP